jgi:divalent metal cation (Fe/Co/Zn/Cd) transporter
MELGGAVTAPLLRRRALRLEALTLGWNAVEAIVALTAGVGASSTALIGFGLDSVVEVGAALVVVWQFFGASDDRERSALRLIGASFMLLAAYVVFGSLHDLVTRAEPEVAPAGIVLTALSVIVMPVLARVKHRAAHEMSSKTLLADSAQTKLCGYLSASTLAGLGANAVFGWWWADPVAALFLAYVAVSEGRDAWAGRDDCC